MRTSSHPRLALTAALSLLLLLPDVAYGYGGPGSVISGVGALLAAVAAVGAAIFGFFWFPLKKLFHNMRVGEEDEETAAPGDPPAAS